MIIVLPWPDPKLSPNARIHFRPKAALTRLAREKAGWTAKATKGFQEAQKALQGDGPIPVTVTFYPPDRRHRDDDNMIGSCKAFRDGVADALGVNDRRFRASYTIAEPCKPGRVEIALLPSGTN